MGLKFRHISPSSMQCVAAADCAHAVGNKSVFSFLRQLSTLHCSPLLLHAAVQQSIDISCPPGPQQQTRRTLLQRSTAGTDRWKDGRTPYRYTDPAAYYKREVSINSLQPQTFVALLAAYVALVAERVEGGLGNTTADSQAWLALCTQRLHTASGPTQWHI